MGEVFELALAIALNVILPWRVLRWDMSRLPQAQLDRAWNDASFWSAVVAFGPLCLPVHFTKTRRSIGGFALGILATGGVLVVIGVVGVLLSMVLE